MMNNMKIRLTLGLLLVGGAAWAQQALWGGSPIVSPQVNDDATVTFRYYNPAADTVRVIGDFNLAADGSQLPPVIELKKDANGVWEGTTTAPLAPELYSYWYFVDGVRSTDPANVYTARDVSTISNIFLVGGGCDGLYAVNDVPHGTMSKVWYHSDAFNTDRRLTVYTPAGYETSGKNYPVLYLLHGMGGDENAWSELGRACQILDNMIAAGTVRPMIVVMPNGNVDMPAAPGESHLGLNPPTFNLPHTMDGQYETAFPEIINYVDTHYRTRTDKGSRAVAGLSMGGFHSLHIAMAYPDKFSNIGLFSAAIWSPRAEQNAFYDDMEGKLQRLFSGDDAPALWIAIGKEDFLYETNTKFRELLDGKSIAYTYVESAEGHIWRNWRNYLVEFLPRLFK